MNGDQREPRAVRITLLLGGGEATRSALELLTQLAWKGSIEALGIFIEDSSLLRLAQMPFSRELCRVTHAEAPLEKADLERQLRIQARTAKLAFESAAAQAGINHAFLTRRGGLAALLQQAAQEMDLMILGPAHRLRQLSEPVSLTAIARHSRQPVVALYDGTESAERALLTAKQLAEAGDRQLTVLIAAEERDAAGVLQQRAIQTLAGSVARYRFAAATDIATLLETSRSEHAGTLVMGVSENLLKTRFLQELSRRLEFPALLVR
ncbi:MAG: universal stress protein [Gammaproteobacteria bacterium]|nr:universal stress protein [Gammaproteobacteria bacterium]